MPRKARKPVAAVVDHVQTLRALMNALGVRGANTMTAWKNEGAPEGPPYSIVSWYAWARSRNYKVELPRDPNIARLCQVAAKPHAASAPPAAAGIARELVEIGTKLGITQPDESMIDSEADRTMAWQRWAAAVRGALDVQERLSRLIPVDVYRKRLRAMSDSIIAQLQDVHGVARDVVGMTHQQRAELRDGLTRWLTLTRQRMSATAMLNPTALSPEPDVEATDATG